MKIVVTGANGFIGQHLVEYLRTQKIISQVLALSRKNAIVFYSSDKETWSRDDLDGIHHHKSIIEDFGCDILFHCAGNPNTNSATAFSDNILLTEHYLNISPRGTTFVLMSSCSVYGDTDGADELTKPIPTSMYAASKLASDLAVATWSSMGYGRALILRLGAVVGHNMTHGAVKAILEKCKLTKSGQIIELYGNSPGAIKPYIDIATVCEAATRLAVDNKTGVWNVASNSISIETILGLCRKHQATYKDFTVKWVGDAWIGDNHKVHIINNKLQDYLGRNISDSEKIIAQYIVEDAYKK